MFYFITLMIFYIYIAWVVNIVIIMLDKQGNYVIQC